MHRTVHLKEKRIHRVTVYEVFGAPDMNTIRDSFPVPCTKRAGDLSSLSEVHIFHLKLIIIADVTKTY